VCLVFMFDSILIRTTVISYNLDKESLRSHVNLIWNKLLTLFKLSTDIDLTISFVVTNMRKKSCPPTLQTDSIWSEKHFAFVRIKMESNINTRHTVYNNSSLRSNMAAANTIAKSLSAKLEWEENGISWYAWTNLKSEYAFLNHNASLFILLSSKVRYDFKYQYTDSIINVNMLTFKITTRLQWRYVNT
jgi:hypothetical protein